MKINLMSSFKMNRNTMLSVRSQELSVLAGIMQVSLRGWPLFYCIDEIDAGAR